MHRVKRGAKSYALKYATDYRDTTAADESPAPEGYTYGEALRTGTLHTYAGQNYPRYGPLDIVRLRLPDIGRTEAAYMMRLAAPKMQVVYPGQPSQYTSRPGRECEETQAWDPSPLLRVLYAIREPLEQQLKTVEVGEDEAKEDTTRAMPAGARPSFEGYMEKLPKCIRQVSVLKKWQKRYFIACQGELFYFSDQNAATRRPSAGPPTPLGNIRLREAIIKRTGPTMLEIENQSEFLVVRVQTEDEAELWLNALKEETASVALVRKQSSAPISASTSTKGSPSKQPPSGSASQELTLGRPLVMDIGSESVRAGLSTGHWPTLFSPAIVASSAVDGVSKHSGFDALLPGRRSVCFMSSPLRDPCAMEKPERNIDYLQPLWMAVYADMHADRTEHPLILTEPQRLSHRERSHMVEVLLESMAVPGVFIEHQASLARRSFRKDTGIVVDVGDRTDVALFSEGKIMRSACVSSRRGGGSVSHALAWMVSQQPCVLFSPVESYVARYIKEQMCYVKAHDGAERPVPNGGMMSLQAFSVPNGCLSVTLGRSVHEAPEVLFHDTAPNVVLPETGSLQKQSYDSLSISRLVEAVMTACPHELQKEAFKNIYLSGGTTMLPGFSERLQEDLSALQITKSIPVRVNAEPYRYHSAFVGACMLGESPEFEQVCLWKKDWQERGDSILKEWAHSDA